MARQVQEPTVTDEGDAQVYRHPAYAQIGAGRIEGVGVLYGSDFTHQRMVRIRIGTSELRRSLSNDWFHGSNRSYIEVDLSEAQWATFVSSMNVGQGVPCTLRYKDGVPVPELPAPVDRSAQFASEVKAKMQQALSELEELEAAIAASGLSQKKVGDLVSRVRAARSRMGPSVEFIAQEFDEHMERTVESAKVEVNAYATGLVQRAGLHAIAGAGAQPVLELTYGAKPPGDAS